MAQQIFSIWKIALFGGLLVLAGLFWLNSHVSYQAKSAILVKSKSAEVHIAAKTIASFSTTKTFEERTLGSTRLQESAVGERERDEQEKAIKKIRAKGGKTGGLIVLTATDKESAVAEVLAQEGTETLLRMARLYLGSEEELGLIVIDQAILTKTVEEPLWYGLKTFFSALGLGALILALTPLFEALKEQMSKIMSRRNKGEESEDFQVVPEERDSRFVPQKLDPAFLYPEMERGEEFFSQPKASDVLKEEVYGEAPQAGLQSVSVAMDDLPFTFETKEEESKLANEEQPPISEVTSTKAEEQAEPTVLEYKRRLNELLAQK